MLIPNLLARRAVRGLWISDRSEAEMIFEFDSDQRLWQETVREVVAKECTPALVRSIADQGVDPAQLWRLYSQLGWTELTEPEEAVELAIVLEELGRATDMSMEAFSSGWFERYARSFGGTIAG